MTHDSHQGKWWWAVMPAVISQAWSCSPDLHRAPAPYLTCLLEDMPTPSPFCPGGGWLSVEDIYLLIVPTLTLAYHGLQALPVGRISTQWGGWPTVSPNDYSQPSLITNFQSSDRLSLGVDTTLSSRLHHHHWLTISSRDCAKYKRNSKYYTLTPNHRWRNIFVTTHCYTILRHPSSWRGNGRHDWRSNPLLCHTVGYKHGFFFMF